MLGWAALVTSGHGLLLCPVFAHQRDDTGQRKQVLDFHAFLNTESIRLDTEEKA